MQKVSSGWNGQARIGVAHMIAVTIVVAIGAIMLVPSVSALMADTPLAAGPTGAAATTPYVTGVSILNKTDSLNFTNPTAPATLNIFAMANSGVRQTTGFWVRTLVSAVDSQGHIAAGIAATQADLDNYTTSDYHFSIGAVGVSGFQFYGEKTTSHSLPIR